MSMSSLEPSDALNELLAGYVLGDLTPEEAARVHHLIETDPEIAKEVNRLQTILGLVPLSLAPTSVPQGSLSRLLVRARQQEEVKSPDTKKHLRVVPLSWAAILAMLATFALGGLFWENQKLKRALTAAQNLSAYRDVVTLLGQPNNRFLALKGITPDSNASGSLVIAPRKESAMLVMRDLQPLPKDKVYRMWAFVDGKKLSCADFIPNAQGEVFLKLPLDRWGRTTEVVITIEPARPLPYPVGKMVITGS